MHFSTSQLSAGALAGIGHVSDDDLMNQGFVVLTTKHGVRSRNLRGFLALFINNIQFHSVAP